VGPPFEIEEPGLGRHPAGATNSARPPDDLTL
jgi:hypothetical protein